MHFKQQNYRKTRWKNGQGVTSEIAIHPEGASIADETFLWRLSTAEIAASGSFSVFRGYDRHLTVLSGEKLQLRFEKDLREKWLAQGEVIQFSGDEAVSCEIQAGVVTDLGLIYRRDLVKAEFKMIELNGPASEQVMTSRQALIYVVSGNISGIPAGVRPGDIWSVGPGKLILQSSAGKVALITLDW